MVTQLGPYLIDEMLAEGGMARVFRARLRGPGGFEKTLVLKQIRPELALDPRFVEMFVREANTLVQMSHPHIVPVYELGAVDGSYYLSMEYIDGATLAQLLEDGPLGPALVAQIGVQLCDALDYAHGRFGILHRDITPRNLIVDDAGHVRLLDFGIAAALDVGGAERFGSPGYMSPEQVRGETLKPASDLFSLGAALFEALTGKPAFEKSVKGSLRAAPSLVQDSNVPRALAALVDSLLAQDPQKRPQSALDTGRPLREWLAQNHPGGAFAELRERARSVRTRARAPLAAPSELPASTASFEPRTTPLGTTPLGPTPLGAASTAQAHTFATSPVLTEMLRSATFAARPLPVSPSATLAPKAVSSDGPSTRRIEADEAPTSATGSIDANDDAEPAAHPRATAFMLRWWPTLALVAFAVAGVVMLGAPQAKRDAESASDGRPDTTQRPQLIPPIPPISRPSQPARTDAGSRVTTDAGAKPAPVVSEVGFLTLNATPWAEVSLDGRKLGTTPLRRVRARAGSHVLRFDCPPLGKTARVNLTIKADAEARVMVDLSTTPPRTILDGQSELR